MSAPRTKKIWIVTGVCAAAIVALFGQHGTLRAQEAAPAITVGTFQPGRVAEATGVQQRLMEQVNGLQQRMMQAQQSGDQAAMQQIQTEAQDMQRKAIEDFEASIEQAMPAVAEKTGVQIIALEVSYMAPGITSKDVTAEVIAELGGTEEEAPAEEGAEPQAQ
ncbi:MAG: hypothetical protein KF886_06285 [Candidatus Hydrogenedentes bacterium]|nr:hypothetical protein [Candidatus Hydrogenedentota bacterium]